MNIENAVKEIQLLSYCSTTGVGLPPLMAAYATQYMHEHSRALKDLSRPSYNDVVTAPAHALVAASPTRVQPFGEAGNAPMIYITTRPGIRLDQPFTKDRILDIFAGMQVAVDRLYENLVATALGIAGSNKDHLPLTDDAYAKCYGYVVVSDIIAEPPPMESKPRAEFKDGLFCFSITATVSMAVLLRE